MHRTQWICPSNNAPLPEVAHPQPIPGTHSKLNAALSSLSPTPHEKKKLMATSQQFVITKEMLSAVGRPAVYQSMFDV